MYILYLSSIYTILAWHGGDVLACQGLVGDALPGVGKEQGYVELIISNSSSKPIYEQITSQIKGLILSGELAEGDQLPSIRALANSLRVSAITTKRAYADLESAGFIETVQGKGSFVAGGNAELIREEQLRQVEARMDTAIDAGRSLGLTDAELKEMFELALETGGQDRR